jgi:hypothetical protein
MRNRIVGFLVFLVLLVALLWSRYERNKPFPQPGQNRQPLVQQPAVKALPDAPAVSESELAAAEKFSGTWAYDDHGSTSYFRVSRAGSRFRFELRYKYEGKFSSAALMVKGADGVYLQPVDGELKGEFISGNFYATHGEDFTYRVTLAAETNEKLSYSVYSSIDQVTKKVEATKIAE